MEYYVASINDSTYQNNVNIVSVDLDNIAWTNNTMHRSFAYCTNLTSVTNINENVSFMDQTFLRCTSLVNAPTIPNSITNLFGIFYQCFNLINAPTIPNSVTIMDQTFRDCTSLVNAPTIPNSVIKMFYTFQGCNNLTDAPVIPSSVTNIYGTFRDCVNLVNAPTIPNSVTDISYTFNNCINLVNAPVIPNYVVNMNSTFYSCRGLKTISIISNSVANMHNTFAYCNHLVNVPDLPNTVTNMCNTFYRCYDLVNAPVIPNSVINMKGTFQYCANLGDVYINSSIVEDAFESFMESTYYPTLNKNVYIPFKWKSGRYTRTYNSFISAGYSTTTRQHNVLLKEIPFLQSDFEWEYVKTNNTMALYAYTGSNTNVVIPNSINNCKTMIFKNKTFNTFEDQLVNIDFNNVQEENNDIGGLFRNCSNLKSVSNINENITNMAGCFWNCYNLISAPNIPSSVNEIFAEVQTPFNWIEYSIFNSCTNLTGNIYIHSNQISRATNCFYNTSLEKNVYIPFTYANGEYTQTYNAFINAGYSTTTRKEGALLFDINQL